MDFFYDEVGQVFGFKYNSTEYWYIRNAQGDIIGIINNAGTQVVTYTYDAWGNPISTTGSLASTVGASNPYRYRGYYFDTETGFYYCNSRYYDPANGRWINADSGIAGVGGDVLGYNLYTYCFNNPVNLVDYDGNKPGDLFDTMDEAAKDFAEYINAKSIEDNCEYLSYIYTVKTTISTFSHFIYTFNVWGLFFGNPIRAIPVYITTTITQYSYIEPRKGASDNVTGPTISFLLEPMLHYYIRLHYYTLMLHMTLNMQMISFHQQIKNLRIF